MSAAAVLACSVLMISSHPTPATHMAKMVPIFEKAGLTCEIESIEVAYQNFVKNGLLANNFYDNPKVNFSCYVEKNPEGAKELAKRIAKVHETARAVIIGHGGKFPSLLFEAFEEFAPKVRRILYLDNYEPFVPGEYSSMLADNIKKAQEVWFANSNFVSMPIFSSRGNETGDVAIDLQDKVKFGVGFSPLLKKDVEKLVKERLEGTIRREFLKENGIEDTGQKLIVYLGGANKEYYEQAFPTFLQIVNSLDKETTVILQQHPRSIREGNKDGILFDEWRKASKDREGRAFVSKSTTDKAMAAADVLVYYQTSGILLPLAAGIQMMQVSHDKHFDVGVRNDLCQAIELRSKKEGRPIEEYEMALRNVQKVFSEVVKKRESSKITYEDLMNLVGADDGWEEHLRQHVSSFLRK